MHLAWQCAADIAPGSNLEINAKNTAGGQIVERYFAELIHEFGHPRVVRHQH